MSLLGRRLPLPVTVHEPSISRWLCRVAPPLNQAQQVLSDQMIEYWAHFVHNSEPGSQWPAFHPGQKRLSFQPDGSRVFTNFDDTHQCAFWASLKG